MKAMLAMLVATAAFAIPAIANAATTNPQSFTPVDFGVGPVTTSNNGEFIVTFNIYMNPVVSSSQTTPAALYMTSCSGLPLLLAHHTRHLSNGESLLPTKGGGPYDDVTGLRWTRPVDTAAVLQMSFVGVEPGYFCLTIQDAGDPFGPRYASVDIGMK